ncbi:MAG: hypothetical protein AAGU32_11075 [Bacillota bacterium]
MPDYQKMYHSLFNDVTDTVTKLQQAQQKTEEMYLDSKETVLTTFPGGSEIKSKGSPDRNPPSPKKKPPSRDER